MENVDLMFLSWVAAFYEHLRAGNFSFLKAIDNFFFSGYFDLIVD